MTLSEVIAAATAHHNALLIAGDTDVANRHDYIAAAVAAHLTSEAVVERAARAIYFDQHNIMHDHAKNWSRSNKPIWRDGARAAIRAALGGGEQ